MEPKFKCLYCGKERTYRLASQLVTIYGEFYFKDTDSRLCLCHTFCNIECLLAYIAEWNTHKEQI